MTMAHLHTTWLLTVFLLFCNFPAVTQAANWELQHDGQVWTISDQTGCIEGVVQNKFRLLSRSHDTYRLPTVKGGLQGSEKDDQVVAFHDHELPNKLVVKCVNNKLGIQISKTYFFEPELHWFCKRVEVSAPTQEKGFLLLSAGVKLPGRMWHDAVLHHPGSHGYSHTNLRTSDLDDVVDLRNADSTGMVCLSNFSHDVTLSTVRLASGGQPTFWMFIPKFTGFPVVNENGQLVDYKIPGIERTWSVATPGRWEMPYLYGPVGNGVQEPVAATVAYPVTRGNYADFAHTYSQRKTIREMLNYESLDRPGWVRDIVMSDWEDTHVSPTRTNTLAGRSWKRILDKMWFGYATVVNYGYFVSSWGYPANDAEWKSNYITVSTREHSAADYRQWLTKAGKDPDEYLVEEHERYYVTRNPYKPGEFVQSRQELLTAAGQHPRLKIGDYTHTGHAGFDRTAQFLKDHPDAIVYRRNGEVYGNAADYSGDWHYPIGVAVNNSHPAFQDYWVRRCEERIKNLGIDFYYIDSFCTNMSFVDWKGHTASQEETVYPLYQRLVDTCRAAEIPIFHNSPFGLYNDIGYSEHPWFSTWEHDWRMWASRQMAHNAMNPRGRPLILIGAKDWQQYQTFRSAPSAAMRLFAPILWNVRMSFNGFAHGFPAEQASFTIESLPWIQAGFELRMRTYAPLNLRPRWWAHETELETQPYQLGRSGLIALMNHDDHLERQTITYHPEDFADFKANRPTWVWRIDFPHPDNVSYDGVTDSSPIRRLARHSKAGFFESLPKRVEYSANFPRKRPALLVVTQIPGLIESTNGRPCQLLLPENYGAKVTGGCNWKQQKISLVIKNPHEQATALVPLFKSKHGYRVRARNLSRLHNAGVLPAMSEVKFEEVDVNGMRFIRLFVAKGKIEFVIE